MILALLIFLTKVSAEEIEATVVLENLTNKKMVTGEFLITNLGKIIEINKIENFKIKLPKKGFYQFSFLTDKFDVFTYYPAKINRNKNIITIRLMEKITKKNVNYSIGLQNDTKPSDMDIENQIANGTLNFVIYGICNSIPAEYLKFKGKYGIGLIIENCVIEPFSSKKIIQNNQIIYEYLNKKYGLEWLKELSPKPFGIK